MVLPPFSSKARIHGYISSSPISAFFVSNRKSSIDNLFLQFIRHGFLLFSREKTTYGSHVSSTSTSRNHCIGTLRILQKKLRFRFPSAVDEATIAIAFKSCGDDMKSGRQLHALSISSGFVRFVSVSNSAMNMYCKFGKINTAVCIFDRIQYPDTVSWNTLLYGLRISGNPLEFAARMNRSGVSFDMITCSTVLAFCSDDDEFPLGFQLHCLVLKNSLLIEVFVGNGLITLYSKSGKNKSARKVFDEMPNRDNVSWNAIITGIVQSGYNTYQAINSFVDMLREGVEPDHITFSSALSACSHESNLKTGIQIHSHLIKSSHSSHISVCNVLISLYSNCNSIEEADMVFSGMPDRDVISWTTMISIHESEESMSLFISMRREHVYPNDITLLSLIHSISSTTPMEDECRMVHSHCIKTSFTTELNVYNSLITMYSMLGSMADSTKVFQDSDHRNITSWNALISGNVQCELYKNALTSFLSTLSQFKPNQYTLGSISSAIGSSESISLRHGRRCHCYVTKLGLISDPIVSGSLVDMYGKRGSLTSSKKIFNDSGRIGEVCWTSMISAYSRHGEFDSVLKLFYEMIDLGMKPDSITFLSVLAGCGRKGMVDIGKRVFDSMVKNYGIKPSSEHYSCMVDMLGRVGRLAEAEEFVKMMPGRPGISVLQSLLGACRLHGNVEMGRRVGDMLLEMEPAESGTYVLMSNLYAENGRWDEAAEVRKGMRKKGVVKEIGFSWVDVGCEGDSLSLHGFSSEDKSHPRWDEIYRMVHCLRSGMKGLKRQKFYVELNSAMDL